METLNSLTFNSIDKVFTKLQSLGYLSTHTINKVLALTYLCDILNNYTQYITEEDYKAITEAIQCLADNSCFIEFPDFHDLKNKPNKSFNDFIPRLTEDEITRFLENGSLKLL